MKLSKRNTQSLTRQPVIYFISSDQRNQVHVAGRHGNLRDEEGKGLRDSAHRLLLTYFLLLKCLLKKSMSLSLKLSKKCLKKEKEKERKKEKNQANLRPWPTKRHRERGPERERERERERELNQDYYTSNLSN